MITPAFNAYRVFDTIHAADGWYVVDDFGTLQAVVNPYSIAESGMSNWNPT